MTDEELELRVVQDSKAYAFADLIELCAGHLKTHWLEKVRAAEP